MTAEKRYIKKQCWKILRSHTFPINLLRNILTGNRGVEMTANPPLQRGIALELVTRHLFTIIHHTNTDGEGEVATGRQERRALSGAAERLLVSRKAPAIKQIMDDSTALTIIFRDTCVLLWTRLPFRGLTQ